LSAAFLDICPRRCLRHVVHVPERPPWLFDPRSAMLAIFDFHDDMTKGARIHHMDFITLKERLQRLYPCPKNVPLYPRGEPWLSRQYPEYNRNEGRSLLTKF
jgi:hypothetical protein